MGRRTSGARVGLEKIGLVQADASTLRTTQPNLGITISPDGTGTTTITSATSITGNTGITGTLSATSSFSAADGTFAGNVTITAQNQLRLREATGNGTNFLAMRAATNMTADYTITWPAAVAATNGFVLASDTSGNLTWVSAAGQVAVTDPGAVATVHYPLFGTNAGAIPTVLSPNARSNLQFVPSTGEISATIGRYPDVIGSTAASGTLTIRGTTNATKFTAAGGSVRMTDNVASSSTTTGTLVVTGGVGISGNYYVGGIVRYTNTTTSTTTATGALVVSGGVGIGENLFVNGTLNSNGKLTNLSTVNSTTAQNNTTSNIEIQDNNGTVANRRPTLSFHRPAAYATKIVLNDDNVLWFGGWSAPAGGQTLRAGTILPGATNTYDLGSSTLRWRTIFTQDLELNNGIGDYTIVEGEDDLFVYNNKKGKVYKFALIEVDSAEATPKMSDLNKDQ